MGLSQNWIAVRDGDEDALLRELGLTRCGEGSWEIRLKYACGRLPNGWLVFTADRMAFKLDELLPRLSVDRDVLAGEIEEHITYSRLVAFRDGVRSWSVVCNPERGDRRLVVEGEPPEPFNKICEEISLQQDSDPEANYWCDGPTRLGHSLCGYGDSTIATIVWTALEPIDPRRPPRPAPELRTRIAADLLPQLYANGWASVANPRMSELELERQRDGELQELVIEWTDTPGDLEIDILSRTVRAGSSELHLTSLEQSLLYLLAANAGRVVTREEILDTLWGVDYVAESNVVDRQIRNLRARLQNDWRQPRFIATVPGRGYRFLPTFNDAEPSVQTP